MLVHQISYREIVPGKYPIETLAEGVGNCDLFAYVAASILEAGGILLFCCIIGISCTWK
jgi:transglutaminase-like putative cysteine protease